MDASAVAFLIAAGAAAGFAFLIYRRREVAVRGSHALASLRALTLILTLLLIWNPQLPGDLAPQTAADVWVLLDGSMSMARGGDDGADWEQAVSRARDLAASGARLAVFGRQVRVADAMLLDGLAPTDASTRLAAALERAAEAGAREIVVVSDLRIQDPGAAAAVLERTGARVRFERVGGRARNVGLAEAVVPRSVRPDEALTVELVLQGEGGEDGDSVTVDVLEDGRSVTTVRAAMPGDGRQTRVRASLPPPARQGQVRYAFRAVLDGDVFPPDDERVVRVEVGPEVRGVVLVSMRPDWEPRFLLPVLQQVTGLTARGYLHLADGRYLVSGGPAEDRTTVTDEAVRDAMATAELLVLHGVGSAAPAWLLEAARTSGRLLLLAQDPDGAGLTGVRAANPVPGEWYPAPELPASPLAADLSGADFTRLPPLEGTMPLIGATAAPPLALLRDGTGRPEAAMVLAQDAGRRRVTVLARGFWRWGFREGPPLEAYRRLWAAVAGWLLASERLAGGSGVRTELPVVPNQERIEWQAPGLAGETVRLRILLADSAVADTTLAIPPDESFRTNTLPPGEYTFLAERGEGADPAGQGSFDVEGFTDELLLPPTELEAGGGGGAAPGRTARPAGRPLRTHPAPYVLLLLLLCAEWIGRRRLGLR